MNHREKMNIVIAGHVDHGKSTVVGRLLADTGALPDGKLQQVRENCRKNSKPFEYAFLIDALKDEQSQGITIDAARVFFKTALRDYIIIDAPGHIEFLKNMVTGASRAEAALLVIDAGEGIQENSRRHGYMLSMLGIRQIAVLVNKIDIADYSKNTFDAICAEYSDFLANLGIECLNYIPVSALNGDNIAERGTNMPWYNGPVVLDVLDSFEKEKDDLDKPLRLPVQDVYKFTNYGDSRRIVAGTIAAGVLRPQDEIIFYPSGKRTRVSSIEKFNAAPEAQVETGYATGITLQEQVYVRRGEMIARSDQQPPEVASRIKVNLFWLGTKPMVKGHDYLFKLGTARVTCTLEAVHRVIDASTLDNTSREQIQRHDVAECTLRLRKPIAFDKTEFIANTSRFVIVDDYEIRGGGIVREGLVDNESDVREKVMLRNILWEPNVIGAEQRARRMAQKARLVLVAASDQGQASDVAKELEQQLFNAGRFVYRLTLANLKRGVDADIADPTERKEHLRRLGEVSNILLDSGLIVMTGLGLAVPEEIDILETIIGSERLSVFSADNYDPGVECETFIADHGKADAARSICEDLQKSGIIFGL